MNKHVKSDRTPVAQARSRLSAFRAIPLPLVLADAPPVTSDGRDGHINWSLYGNSGSQPIQSAGAFAERQTSFSGTEQSSGSGHIAISRCELSEQVQYFTANGTITFPNGTIQKIAGQVVVMLNAIEIWSGRMYDEDKPASAQYYVTQTIRRQRIGYSKFHLLIYPIQRVFDGRDVGYHKLRVYNDSSGALLNEQDLVLTADPQSNMQVISEISEAVGIGEFLRAEVIAQISLSNPNSPVNPVAGGSFSGAGFLDNVA